MDWNPLTWTFATTLFGVSLLKWGLVVGGIVFLALVRKFILATRATESNPTPQAKSEVAAVFSSEVLPIPVATKAIPSSTTPMKATEETPTLVSMPVRTASPKKIPKAKVTKVKVLAKKMKIVAKPKKIINATKLPAPAIVEIAQPMAIPVMPMANAKIESELTETKELIARMKIAATEKPVARKAKKKMTKKIIPIAVQKNTPKTDEAKALVATEKPVAKSLPKKKVEVAPQTNKQTTAATTNAGVAPKKIASIKKTKEPKKIIPKKQSASNSKQNESKATITGTKPTSSTIVETPSTAEPKKVASANGKPARLRNPGFI